MLFNARVYKLGPGDTYEYGELIQAIPEPMQTYCQFDPAV